MLIALVFQDGDGNADGGTAGIVMILWHDNETAFYRRSLRYIEGAGIPSSNVAAGSVGGSSVGIGSTVAVGSGATSVGNAVSVGVGAAADWLQLVSNSS